MSAYIVEDQVLDYILTFYSTDRFGKTFWTPHSGYVQAQTPEEITAAGQLLLAENCRSVNYRYSEQGEAHAYRFRMHAGAITGHQNAIAVQVLKACDCLDYQSCETDDWRQTDAHAILQQIRARAISRLAGYEAATWGAPEHTSTITRLI